MLKNNNNKWQEPKVLQENPQLELKNQENNTQRQQKKQYQKPEELKNLTDSDQEPLLQEKSENTKNQPNF